MKSFERIKGSTIKDILDNDKRLYLVGDLKLPQKIKHINNKDIEVGITDFKGGEFEKPHYHTQQTEFMYIMYGEVKYREVKTGREFVYSEGDFFHITPGICYTQEALTPTRVFFIKIPSINDKIECPFLK